MITEEQVEFTIQGLKLKQSLHSSPAHLLRVALLHHQREDLEVVSDQVTA